MARTAICVIITALGFIFSASPVIAQDQVQKRLDLELSDATRGPSPNIQKMRDLIERGANVNCCTTLGSGTPLMSAIFRGDLEAIKLLLDSGADVNLQHSDGRTALDMVVAGCGRKNAMEIARLLLEKGADVNIKDKQNRTVLDRSNQTLIYGCKDLHELLVKYKKEGTDPTRDSAQYQRTANQQLVRAAQDGNIEEMKTLIAAGADVNCCKDQGNGTPLMAAAIRRQTRAVKFLLENGAEVNLQDREGQTALHYAVKPCLDDESLNTVRVLLEAGADITILDKNGDSAWSRAYPVSPPPAFSKCKPMRQLLFDYSRKQGAKLNVGWTEGRKTEWQSRLHNFFSIFAGRGEVEELRFAIAAGADVNCCRTEGNGTPLMSASFTGGVEAVKLLLDAGADVNLQDRDGRAALNRAVLGCNDKKRKLPVAELLLQRGADPTIKDREGKTPLDSSHLDGCPEMQQLVRKYRK